ncbi:C-C chemokine receptor type 6 [Alligator sinensis]|uniref:C-C chemokine receptor type 6 n=1 Tax=Alligator sinensis TaxID=38654 RepID=A0A1U7SLG2_ALLSI|nr:C-C chemokine receptor type 6 [Alligator sinensis]XP_006037912.1 C-C chemokine receptor type 6 [Alligator sinensis]
MELHDFLSGDHINKMNDAEMNSTDYPYTIDYEGLIEPCNKQEVRNFTKVFFPVTYSLICVVGFIGNVFVVMTFALYKNHKSMTDVYLFNLAIVDLLFVLTLPLWAMSYAADKWIFNDVICKMTRGIYAINFNCGMLLLAFISLDRYIAIVQATKSFKLRARTLAYSKLICLVVWVFSILISTCTFIYSESYSIFLNDTTEICELKFSKEVNSTALKLMLMGIQLAFGFFIPLLFMIFCYAFIVKTLVQAQNSKRSKAIRVILLIVAVFLVCQVPYNIVLLITATNMGKLNRRCDSERHISYAKCITETVAFLHCCLNPVLYAFVGVKFRNYFLKIMNSLCCIGFKKYKTANSRISSDIYHSRQTSEITSDNVSSFTM